MDYLNRNFMPVIALIGLFLAANLIMNMVFYAGVSSHYDEIKLQCDQTYDKGLQSVLHCSEYQ